MVTKWPDFAIILSELYYSVPTALTVDKTILQFIRRIARISKRGGFFERVRQLWATLTRILIALKSDSNGLSKIETAFSAEIENSNGFSA